MGLIQRADAFSIGKPIWMIAEGIPVPKHHTNMAAALFPGP